MTKLRAVGHWWSAQAPHLPHPARMVDESWDGEERSLVGTYLSQGQLACQFMGVSRCRLCGRVNGNAELTDGTYLWPSGLGHYVEEHAVRLPAEFVRHAIDRLDALEARELDFSWWGQQTGAARGGGPAAPTSS